MDENKLKVLNHYHVVFLIQNVIIGTAVLSLPNRLSSMGYSQWWMPLLFGMVANLLLIPMIWLAKKYQNDTLFVIHEKLFGKWVGKTINVILLVYFIVVVAAVCSSYLQLNQVVALVDRKITTPLIILLLMLIYIVHGGIKSIARFCIMSFFYDVRVGLLFEVGSCGWGHPSYDADFQFHDKRIFHCFKKRVNGNRRF